MSDESIVRDALEWGRNATEASAALDALVAEVERWHREALDWQQAKSEADDACEAAEAERDQWKANAEQWMESFTQAAERGDAAHQRREAAEAEIARLTDVVAAKDELLMAYRLGSHRKADSALTKLEKLEDRRIDMQPEGEAS